MPKPPDRSLAAEASSSLLAIVCVAAITLLAMLIRLYRLDAQGITLDEGFSIFLAKAPFAEFARTLWRSELNMAPYYLLLRGWIHFGHGEWIIRLLGVALSTATVPVVYGLGHRLFNARTGMVAAALLALQPYHVELARNARSSPLVVLLVCLASLCFLQGLKNPTRLIWAAYALLSAAAVYSHFFALLVIVAQWASLLFLRRVEIPRKHILYALALLIVLLLPWAIFMLTSDGTTRLSWVQPLNAQQLRWLLSSLTLSRGRSLVYVVLWCIAAWSAARASNATERWPFWFVFLWLFVPVLLTVTASLYQPLLVERFLAICLPASVLLAAVGLVELASNSRVCAVVVCALLIVYSASAIRFRARHEEFDEGWRRSSQLVLQNLNAGDVVIAEGMKGMAFDYYRAEAEAPLPAFQRLDSLSSPLPSPPPVNVWILGWTRPAPSAPGTAPRSDDAMVQVFAQAHRNEYCWVAPISDAGVTRVWHFRRCPAGDPASSSAR